MRLIVTNDYHHTSTTALLRPDGTISERAGRRIREALCVSDCQCSGNLGERGPRAITDARGRSYRVEGLHRGSFYLVEELPHG